MNQIVKDKQKQAWELHQEIKNHAHSNKTIFIQLVFLLRKMRDEKLYSYVGEGGYDTFEQYLSDPDIGLSSPITQKKYIAMLDYLTNTLNLTENQLYKVPIYQVSQYFSEFKKKPVEEARELIHQLSYATSSDRKKIIHEANISLPKPTLYRDYATGKWIVEFSPDFTLKVYDTKNNRLIFENETNSI